jgi:DNA-directed RNA polymerase specialized sigma24 family protein
LAYFKRHYGAEFKAALAEAVESLSVGERNVLRYSVVEKLDASEIGTLYSIQ